MTSSDLSSYGPSSNGHLSTDGGSRLSTNGNDYLSINGHGSPTTNVYVPSIEEDAIMPIAIVGMAGRFPGDATDPEKLWDLIVKART